MNWQSSMETYTLPHVKQWEFAVWHKELNPALCDNLEWWDGVGGGREVYEGYLYVYLWLIHVDIWQTLARTKQLSSNKTFLKRWIKDMLSNRQLET